jgi:protein SCO1/2
MSNLSQKLLMGAIVIAALVAGIVFGGMVRDDAADTLASGGAAELQRYEIGGEFELTNQRGERMRLSDLAGRALVMFFGYTYCPDVCPATLSRVREVKDALPPEDAARFTGVLVSVDPARDTPHRLGQYVEFFDPAFVGLTGSEDELEDIARRYGAQFVIPEGQPKNGYLVNHSTVAYLIDPLGYVRALYYGDEPVDAIASNVREVLEELG